MTARSRASGWHRVSTVNDWLIPVDLAYEIDVWGRVRRSFESSKAQAAATADDAGAVRLTVETDVAQFYYTLRSLDAQGQILAKTSSHIESRSASFPSSSRTGW